MMPNNPSSIEKLTQSRLAGDASKSAFSLDHPLTSSANKHSKAHSQSGKQVKAALDPIKHHKAKHHKAKHHKKQKHVTRFLLSPAAGNGVQFANFADTSSLKLNGNSSQAGSVLRLTPAQKNQAGSAFVKTPYTIGSDTSFNTRFQFRLSGGDGNNGADGMTFMLQNSAAGVNALGTLGGGEGYSTIGNSLAIEFDSFKSSWDSRVNQVSLLKNGNERSPLATANTPMDLNNSGALNAWIDYDGATNQLSVFLANSTTKPATALLKTQVDITSVGTQAFVGFSAGTGGLTNNQDVENWQFTTSTPAPPPPPVPPSNVILATNASETITGTTGNDTVSYANAVDGIIADLGTGAVSRIARIMPLGDSITQGVTDRTTDPGRVGNGGYRVVLSKKFAANGLQTNFVGTRKNGTINPDPTFSDIDHEGHPGQTIEYLTNNTVTGDLGIANYLSTNKPDVVLLMAGTNDLFQKEPNGQFTSAAQMSDRLGILIDKAFQTSPNVRILVSSIPPIQPNTLTQSDLPAGMPISQLPFQQAAQVQRVKDYNSLVSGLVAAQKQAGKSIDFVNMFNSLNVSSNISSSDISPKALDTGVHPTAQGYDKIGNLWFNALNSTIGTAQGTYKVDQDTLDSIENLIGSTFNDTIISGSGSNILTGNGGADTFFYRTPSDGNDTITDFGTDDRFQISAAGFSGLAAGVALSNGTAASTGVFVNGNSAISGNATFLYSGGSLWFDADGTGASSQVKIADLSTQPASLSASQFTIVA
jgi:lysophospholipase L1-like esterase